MPSAASDARLRVLPLWAIREIEGLRRDLSNAMESLESLSGGSKPTRVSVVSHGVLGVRRFLLESDVVEFTPDVSSRFLSVRVCLHEDVPTGTFCVYVNADRPLSVRPLSSNSFEIHLP